MTDNNRLLLSTTSPPTFSKKSGKNSGNREFFRENFHQDFQGSGDFHSIPADFYRFHLKENIENPSLETRDSRFQDFGGFLDLFRCQNGSPTIKSSKGTVRGVRNRVRNGVTTFLQNEVSRVFTEREKGKVVVYVTSLGIVRETFHRCLKVTRILRTLMVSFEQKDVFVNQESQREIVQRTDNFQLPLVFVEGQLLGDSEAVEKMNETGELRRILYPYKRRGSDTHCCSCGGYRYIPCPVCGGSKKSLLRQKIQSELVHLKCVNCDYGGLVPCDSCNSLNTSL